MNYVYIIEGYKIIIKQLYIIYTDFNNYRFFQNLNHSNLMSSLTTKEIYQMMVPC